VQYLALPIATTVTSKEFHCPCRPYWNYSEIDTFKFRSGIVRRRKGGEKRPIINWGRIPQVQKKLEKEKRRSITTLVIGREKVRRLVEKKEGSRRKKRDVDQGGSHHWKNRKQTKRKKKESCKSLTRARSHWRAVNPG